MANFPKYVAIFNAEWQDIGLPDEALKVTYNYPTGNPGTVYFFVGTDIFLETPTNCSQIPDEHLISSLSMASILAGNILPGTFEYIDAITGQGTKYFQTIIGNVTLKSVTPVIDSSIGPMGTVYDVEFQKVGSGTNTKTLRLDAWTMSQYDNRVDSPAHSIYCLPGAIHKEFGLKKSQLGAEGSANRTAIIEFINTRKFWV